MIMICWPIHHHRHPISIRMRSLNCSTSYTGKSRDNWLVNRTWRAFLWKLSMLTSSTNLCTRPRISSNLKIEKPLSNKTNQNMKLLLSEAASPIEIRTSLKILKCINLSRKLWSIGPVLETKIITNKTSPTTRSILIYASKERMMTVDLQIESMWRILEKNLNNMCPFSKVDCLESLTRPNSQ